jgi:hypothetical protein
LTKLCMDSQRMQEKPRERMFTLIKAGPARSIEFTRNQYHHSVPDLSLSRSLCRGPSHIAGTVRITGTNMMTKWRNRKPVQMGSHIYTSRNKTIPCRNLENPWSSSDNFFVISSLDAASMRVSAVCSVPLLSFSESRTNTAGLRAVTAHSI